MPVAIVFVVAIIVLLTAIVSGILAGRRVRRLPEAERAAAIAEARAGVSGYGAVNTLLVCPHCQTAGHVRTKPLKKKVGISGGKATAAVLTGGASLLATGLSRKEAVTQSRCDRCSSEWQF